MENHEKIEISDETRKTIIDDLVQPYYVNTVTNTIGGKICWRKTGITFETVSKVMVALGSILSFSAGYYHDDTLSFISGSVSCLSLACLQFSSFAYKENKKQGDELNIILKKLKLDTVPALARDDFGMQAQSARQNPYDNRQQQEQQQQVRMLQMEIERLYEALTEKHDNTPYQSQHHLSRLSPSPPPLLTNSPAKKVAFRSYQSQELLAQQQLAGQQQLAAATDAMI